MATRERKYARTQGQKMLIWISECHVGLELYFYFCSLALNFIAWHFIVLAFYSDVVKPHNCTATPSSSTAVLLKWEFPTRNGTSKPANYTVRGAVTRSCTLYIRQKFAIKLVGNGKTTTVKRPLNYKKFGRSLHESFQRDPLIYLVKEVLEIFCIVYVKQTLEFCRWKMLHDFAHLLPFSDKCGAESKTRDILLK